MSSGTAVAIGSKDEWHENRGRHIGGSEIGALFYMWEMPSGQVEYLHMFQPPPKDGVLLGCAGKFEPGYRLFYQKVGILERPNLDDVEYVQAGQFLEPAIAQWAMHKWRGEADRWPLRKVRRYLSSQKTPGLGASRDYEVHASGLPPVECKNVSFFALGDDWVIEDREICSAPLQYMLQLQAQIAADDDRSDHGWIVACVNGSELVRGRFDRQDAAIAKIRDAATCFWQAVDAGEQPPAYLADAKSVSLIFAEGRKVERPVQVEDPTWPDLCQQLLDAKAEAKRAAEVEDRIKAQVCLLIGENSKAEGFGWKATWPAIERQAKTISYDVKPGFHRGGLTVKAA